MTEALVKGLYKKAKRKNEEGDLAGVIRAVRDIISTLRNDGGKELAEIVERQLDLIKIELGESHDIGDTRIKLQQQLFRENLLTIFTI